MLIVKRTTRRVFKSFFSVPVYKLCHIKHIKSLDKDQTSGPGGTYLKHLEWNEFMMMEGFNAKMSLLTEITTVLT